MMNRNRLTLRLPFLLVFVAVSLLLPATALAKETDVSDEVQEAFDVYRRALTHADGTVAAEIVSADTIDLYQQYRDLAVFGDEKTVKDLSMVNRMQVLIVRLRVKPETLKAMDGKATFAYAVDNEWIGKDVVVRAGLTDIAVTGNRATGKVTLGGEPTTEIFHFRKENNGWKFDLVPTIKKTDQALQMSAKSRNVSENEFLFSILTSLTGNRVTENVWKPLE